MALDYNEFKNFLERFKKLQKNHEKFLRDFLTEMAMQTLANTKLLTPVDTGNLRNRWELSKVMRRGDELYIVLFNPLEYASFVEDGHMQRRRFLPIEYLDTRANQNMVNSLRARYGQDMTGIMLQGKWIAGHHMARISITKIEREIPKKYDKALQIFMSGLGVAD